MKVKGSKVKNDTPVIKPRVKLLILPLLLKPKEKKKQEPLKRKPRRRKKSVMRRGALLCGQDQDEIEQLSRESSHFSLSTGILPSLGARSNRRVKLRRFVLSPYDHKYRSWFFTISCFFFLPCFEERRRHLPPLSTYDFNLILQLYSS